MSDTALILEVAVPVPLFRSLDYRAPAGLAAAPPAGVRVLVPFGRRQLVGVLLGTRRRSEIPEERLRSAAAVLDAEPVLDPELLQLLLWAGDYYHHPVGEVITAALPVRLRKPGASRPARPGRWQLTDAGRKQAADGLPRAARQRQVLQQLATATAGLPRGELRVPLGVLKTLEGKGWIRHVELADASSTTAVSAPQHRLTQDQQAAVAAVSAAFGRFGAFLLEGVTGSGKTEVYLQLIAPLLQSGRQVLVLVPEIGLTPQLVNRFRQRFDTGIAVLHSGLNDSERLAAWEDAREGRAGVILGTRSAVFTPLRAPGLIIVDEEHDSSLKQQDRFRYSARDLAVRRAQQLGIPVLLGSATPSLESLYNVQQGRYRLLSLPQRAGAAQAPAMRLLDLRNQPMRNLLSETLAATMETHLKKRGQVLLFLNRRGFSPVLLCHSCGWVAECRRCDSRMTLHQSRHELRCHHCGSQRRVDSFCPACGSSELVGIGEGTERVEDTLRERFPDYPVLRIDRDTTRRKGRLEEVLAEAEAGRFPILLGTQMLAKGHHFPEVTLVAILDADQGLFSTDFRASERLAQLIIQVAGRAGRADRPGEVVIQTHNPDHPLLLQLVERGYPAFASAALEERREAQLPPWSSMALLRAEAPQARHPRAFLERARELAAPWLGSEVQLWGPVAAPMERRAGRYRAQLLLQSCSRAALQRLLKHWLPGFETLKEARRVRWSIDVDPVDMF